MARWEAIGDILAKLRKQHGALSKRIDEALAMKRWDEVVGPLIARHARPTGMRPGGILCVEVDHPAWRAELHHRKRQILDRLNSVCAEAGEKEPVRDLFLVEPRGRTSHFNPPGV